MARTSRRRRALLVIVSVIAAAGLGEALARAIAPDDIAVAGSTVDWFAEGAGDPLFEADPELGFRPRLGTAKYDEFGAHPNAYAKAKPPGTTRVLFLGDSVTDRGTIVRGLREQLGEDGIEYWNCGVGAFNTRQEVEFYLRHNATLEPDHVVLTFHLNDFQVTPAVFRDESGELLMYSRRRHHDTVQPWLWDHSCLYRLLVEAISDDTASFEAHARDVRTELERLRDELARTGVRFTVLILPLFHPIDSWPLADRRAHTRILEIARDLGLPHYDLRPALRTAYDLGLEVTETPDDRWHPSPAAGHHFASWLITQGWRP